MDYPSEQSPQGYRFPCGCNFINADDVAHFGKALGRDQTDVARPEHTNVRLIRN
jgi:hypothetical protein